MKILHLAPIEDGFIVGDCEYQTVVAVMEDSGEEFAAVLDHNNRSCHIVRIINKILIGNSIVIIWIESNLTNSGMRVLNFYTTMGSVSL